jgi:hypothetical protein
VIHPKPLQRWESVGRVLNSQSVRDGRRFWISLAHDTKSENGTLIELHVSCIDGTQACGSPTTLHSISVPDGFLPVGGEDNSVALVSKDSVARSGSEQASQPLNKVPHGLSLESLNDAVVAVSQDQILVLSRKGNAMHDLSSIRGGTINRRLLMMPPSKDAETLEAATVKGDRLFLTSDVEPINGGSSLYLWDCPSVIIERSATSPADDCMRYQAPAEIQHAVALATRDLSSMFDFSIRFPSDCGDLLAVQHRGWLWIIDRRKGLQDLLPADGIVRCNLPAAQITTFRARRIDELILSMRPAKWDKGSILSLPINH